MQRIDSSSILANLDGFSDEQKETISNIISSVEIQTVRNCLSSVSSCDDVNDTCGDTDVIWLDAQDVVDSILIDELKDEFSSVITDRSNEKDFIE